MEREISGYYYDGEKSYKSTLLDQKYKSTLFFATFFKKFFKTF